MSSPVNGTLHCLHRTWSGFDCGDTGIEEMRCPGAFVSTRCSPSRGLAEPSVGCSGRPWVEFACACTVGGLLLA